MKGSLLFAFLVLAVQLQQCSAQTECCCDDGPNAPPTANCYYVDTFACNVGGAFCREGTERPIAGLDKCCCTPPLLTPPYCLDGIPSSLCNKAGGECQPPPQEHCCCHPFESDPLNDPCVDGIPASLCFKGSGRCNVPRCCCQLDEGQPCLRNVREETCAWSGGQCVSQRPTPPPTPAPTPAPFCCCVPFGFTDDVDCTTGIPPVVCAKGEGRCTYDAQPNKFAASFVGQTKLFGDAGCTVPVGQVMGDCQVLSGVASSFACSEDGTNAFIITRPGTECGFGADMNQFGPGPVPSAALGVCTPVQGGLFAIISCEKRPTTPSPTVPPTPATPSPTGAPTVTTEPTTPSPTAAPTTGAPTTSDAPTGAPTTSDAPTAAPTPEDNAPTAAPTSPSDAPTAAPTASDAPTAAPTASDAPTAAPTLPESDAPTPAPTPCSCPDPAGLSEPDLCVVDSTKCGGSALSDIDSRCFDPVTVDGSQTNWGTFFDIPGQPVNHPELNPGLFPLKVCDLIVVYPADAIFVVASFSNASEAAALKTSDRSPFYTGSVEKARPPDATTRNLWPWMTCGTWMTVGPVDDNSPSCPSLAPDADGSLTHIGLENGFAQFSYFCTPTEANVAPASEDGQIRLFRVAVPASSAATVSGILTVFTKPTPSTSTPLEQDFPFTCFD